MKDIVEVGILLEIYGNMLTLKQKNLLNLYYNEDLSLAEIAEIEDITRQAVHDNIKKGAKKLFDYEKKLGVMEKQKHHKDVLEKILFKISEVNKKTTDKELTKIISDLKKELNNSI